MCILCGKDTGGNRKKKSESKIRQKEETMNYQEAMEYMEKVGSYGIVPGLDSIKELCRRLGNPQDDLKFVHIAGTNGKGSTLAYISNILQAAGYRVGKYISPVIIEYCEKIQIGKQKISHKDLCEGLEIIRKHCDDMVEEGFHHPTPFEIETALAFRYFKEKKCDIVVLETGMGGREDATNLITTTQVAVLASIGMDHMKFLGNSLEEIAAHKAGICKPGCRVVSMRQKEAAGKIVEQTAENLDCTLIVADAANAKHVKYGLKKQTFDYGNYRKLEISLAGKFQIANAVLAIEAVQALETCGYVIKESAIRKGLKETTWTGRLQILEEHPLFIIDGAHNEDAAVKLADSIEFYFTNKRIIYIMGMLKDKEVDRVIALTEKYADQILTVTPPENLRAMHAYDLAQEVAKVHPNVTAVDSLEEAVELSHLLAGKNDVILCFGSLSYLGRILKIMEKRQATKGTRKAKR